MNPRTLTAFLLTGMAAMTIVPAVKSDVWNEKTVITFSGPVEIPGQILPAGTYVFKLANSTSNRNIVQIFNESEDHIFGTFLAIPDYRLRPPDKTILRFEERPAGSPQAIKGWFYPGKNYGHEFVYPKREAVELAKVNHTPVPSMPTELAPDTTKPSLTMKTPEVMALLIAPIVVEEPNGQEVDVAEVFGSSDTVSSLPEELPETASPLPLIGLIGLLSLGTAAGLRIAARTR
jgi:hypothetical protein